MQSLLPLLSMRLAAPDTLVDINRVPGLDTVVSKVMELGLERVYYLENTAEISYCWHPKVRILVGENWWCQWWEKIPED